MMDASTLAARLDEAIDRAGGLYTPASIDQAVRAGRMQLWRAPDDVAVVVTQIGTYPATKVLWVLLAAGELNAVMALQDTVALWAKAMGCSRIVMDGRAGWDKVLPQYGWRRHCVRHVLPL